MRPFEYASPKTKEQVVPLLGKSWGEVEVLAGGTDLLSLMKDEITAPHRLVNIKSSYGPGFGPVSYFTLNGDLSFTNEGSASSSVLPNGFFSTLTSPEPGASDFGSSADTRATRAHAVTIPRTMLQFMVCSLRGRVRRRLGSSG